MLSLLSALPVFASCGVTVSRDEVARVASPGGQAEAVLVETNGGAITSFGYEVHVVERGGSPDNEVAWLYGAVRNANAYGANRKWVGEKALVVEYLEARDQALRQPSLKLAGKEIEVSLRSGVVDPAAPAGGMAYNLERTRNER
jgi:hypothetical protein